jgi:S1-C subfamily serine protease
MSVPPISSEQSAPVPPFAAGYERIPEAVERVAAAAVGLRSGRRGAASGTLWEAGVVVTAAHAVHADRPVQILLSEGREAMGTLAGVDHATDIAVLRCEPAVEAPIGMGSSDAIRAGSFVFAVARESPQLHSASFGFVGMAAGPWQTWRGGLIERLIRLDGGLYPGFSGGPVATPDGTVFGIASAALARGFGMVIPSETVSRVARELLAHGRVDRAYLGIVTQPAKVAEAILSPLGLTGESGLLITSIGADSPAAKSGLLVGDILLELAANRLLDTQDLQAALFGQTGGSKVPVRLVRGGKGLDLEVELGERPRRRCW